ncbi:MAG: 1-acyl-sn-glycerol-3-phosphate acyltransferase, partial [Flavobacteriales bacterium]
MRILYLFLWFAFHYSFRLYFRKIKNVNPSNYFFGRTIFVSNHQGSFMDPLLIASQRKPIVFFMTRSDVFTKFTKPLLWMVHMLPIYRQRDGVDTKEKNAKIFEKTNIVLKNNRNILIFGEGFTDDRIQRRLHPIKKGPARIGFSALEYCGWSKDIYLQGLGVNYTDFNLRRSDVLMAAGNKIRLNDFKSDYQENPSKTITDVTRILESDMRQLVTDVHNPELADTHEDIMMITRKGMHPICFEPTLSIESRWLYSKALAQWINGLTAEQLSSFHALAAQLNEYKQQLVSAGITENERFLSRTNAWKPMRSILKMVILFPAALLGALHAGWIYWLVKRWVETTFKRPVFWGSTKKVMSVFAVGILNLPCLFLMPIFLPWTFQVNLGISIMYFLAIGLLKNRSFSVMPADTSCCLYS